ncbi:MAG: class I SAM-dependent methyltransferase [Sorangiineae bacterium]|nr:class I SAM-dependent methyltransferase [Polyangiaceae bacterium]MEB2324587.1 class I SAM-dependent methyltransferase [Sorangiineae bacterium]
MLVVDKPSGLVVHGGSATLATDLVSRLAARLSARGASRYLGVHQRLDKDASGVLCFTRDRALNVPIARELEEHTASRVYVAAVADGGLPARGVLENGIVTDADGRSRVVLRGGKPSMTRFSVLERASGRALVELRPMTGRTHQLRVQLAHARSPIAGDTLYGGPPAPRLLLHARALELRSLGRRFEAREPPVFARWLRGEPPALGDADELRAKLADALAFRHPLAASADAFRLFNGEGDGLPGVAGDRLGDFAVLELSTAEAIARRAELARMMVELGAEGVYVKVRARGDARRADAAALAPAAPDAGRAAPAEYPVREGGLRFLVRLGDGPQTGLFLDQRDNRERVRALAGGARVLNLFAYTCSFTVAAAVGGASATTSVDTSAPALARGRANLELNRVAGGAHRLLRDDALEYLDRARRRDERFELVILDPPSFATRGRGTFTVARDYARVAAGALAVLAPGGRLLAVTNHRKTSRAAFRRVLHAAAERAGRRVAQMKDLASGLDCPDDAGGPAPSKSVLVTVA